MGSTNTQLNCYLAKNIAHSHTLLIGNSGTEGIINQKMTGDVKTELMSKKRNELAL